MIIDIIVAILIILAIIKGFRKGLIVGLFSFLAIIIGLAAALKLSAVVAVRLSQHIRVSERWLPILSFAIVFILVVFLVYLGAKAIQKLAETIMLGWINRLGGIILYIAIYLIVFSVFLFYANQLKFIQPSTKEKSVTYSYVQPWGQKAINAVGAVIPFFKNMFDELENFFGGVSQKIDQKP
jgi:membrane protein required for colicin V production